MFAHQSADAFAFVTYYECEGTCQVGFVIGGPGLAYQPDDPDILFFQEVDGAGEIGFLGNQQVFGSSCRRFDHGGVYLSRFVQGNDDTMYTCRFRAAQERTEIVHILDGIEDE